MVYKHYQEKEVGSKSIGAIDKDVVSYVTELHGDVYSTMAIDGNFGFSDKIRIEYGKTAKSEEEARQMHNEIVNEEFSDYRHETDCPKED